MSSSFRSHTRAIAGFWSFGRSVGPDSCASMLRAMSQNRADIVQPASDLVLGSSDYRPDPRLDTRPPSPPAASAAFFVADLRIDNHEDLVRELDLTPAISDDELLAHVWSRWQMGLL